MTENKIDPVKKHVDLRNLALAFAIIFAAGVFGFVSSKAFAIFFLSFIGFLIFSGIGLVLLSAADEMGWFGGIVIGGLFLMAVGTLISGIKESLDAIRSSAPAATAAAPDQQN